MYRKALTTHKLFALLVKLEHKLDRNNPCEYENNDDVVPSGGTCK